MLRYTIYSEKEQIRKMQQEVFDFQDSIEKKGLQRRDGQASMMLDISDAIRDKKHLLVEAGVGIGKSFAYLVPAFLFHKYFALPIIISTSTITLQEQLLSDIQTVSNMIGYHIDPIIAKGQTHYICRSRLAISRIEQELFGEITRHVELGAKERKDFPFKIEESDWSQICVKTNAKLCRRCSEKSECHYQAFRKEIQLYNQIVVCNHGMLSAHIEKKYYEGRGVLPDRAPIIIIDEAHNFVENFRSYMTMQYNGRQIVDITRRASKVVSRLGLSFEARVQVIEECLDTLFSYINYQSENYIKNNRNIKDSGKLGFNPTAEIIEKICSANKLISEFYEQIQIFYSDDLNEAKQAAISDLERVDKFFNAITSRENVVWIELNGTKVGEAMLAVCPRDLSRHIKMLLFSQPNVVIMTSATLAGKWSEKESETYEYAIKSMGYPLNEDESEIIGELSGPYESPFNYAENALLYCADDLPEPSRENEKFMEAACNRIAKLVELSNGRALILFTSKVDLDDVDARLKYLLSGYKILRAQVGASQEKVLHEFREDKTSILLGTGAFWEGINMAGDTLTNVIIFRLPFPVPDPVMQYRVKSSKNPFMDIYVPEMIIKLKQGIGRLIRTETDKGIIAILDSRLSEESARQYRQTVFDALPIKNRTNRLDVVEEFYCRVVKPYIS